MTEIDLATRISVLEAILKEKDTTLRLQASEYERRLSDLNHEHARARDTLATYIPRETYYSEKQSIEARISQLEKSQWVLAGAIALAVFIVPLVIHFWKV